MTTSHVLRTDCTMDINGTSPALPVLSPGLCPGSNPSKHGRTSKVHQTPCKLLPHLQWHSLGKCRQPAAQMLWLRLRQSIIISKQDHTIMLSFPDHIHANTLFIHCFSGFSEVNRAWWSAFPSAPEVGFLPVAYLVKCDPALHTQFAGKIPSFTNSALAATESTTSTSQFSGSGGRSPFS